MLSFAVIAEGVTDQAVIENILLGYFEGVDGGIAVTPVQPPPKLKGAFTAPHAGWLLVLKSLRDGEPAKALQSNDFVVVHVDTDHSQDGGFDVPHADAGKPLKPAELVDRVKVRLLAEMNKASHVAAEGRVIFAIAVHQTECWLLPLLFDDKKKREKTTGCLDAANGQLRKMNEKPLEKSWRRYEEISKAYAKRKTLLTKNEHTPSLRVFVKSLAAIPMLPDSAANDGTKPIPL